MRKNLHTSTMLLIGALAIALISIPLYFEHRDEVVVAYLFSVLAIVLADGAAVVLLRKFSRSFSWAIALPARIITYLVCTLLIYFLLIFIPEITMKVTVVAELIVLILWLIFTVPLISGIGEIRDVDKSIMSAVSFVRESRAAIAASKGYSKEADAILNQIDEALRYSDPKSNEESGSIEKEIATELSSLIQMIKKGDSPDSSKLLNDIKRRNEMLKLSKRGTK